MSEWMHSNPYKGRTNQLAKIFYERGRGGGEEEEEEEDIIINKCK